QADRGARPPQACCRARLREVATLAAVGDLTADARAAPRQTATLDPLAARAVAAALGGGRPRRSRQVPTVDAAAPVHARAAVVEQAAVGAPAAVRVSGKPGMSHGPRRYGWPGRAARSPHIVYRWIISPMPSSVPSLAEPSPIPKCRAPRCSAPSPPTRPT